MQTQVRRRAGAILFGILLVVGSLVTAPVALAATPQHSGYVAAVGNRGVGDIDPWKFAAYYCTSYAAWRVNANGTSWISNGSYNAHQWDERAQEKGISVSTTPSVGAIAVWEAASWNMNFGHVAYVESVNADGSANVSEYNFNVTYGYGTRSGVRANKYIHFNPGPSTPPPAPQWNGVGNATFLGSHQLTTGQRMESGQYILSENAIHALVMQSDGNLVLYSNGSASWYSNTSGHPGAYLGVQGDGNVVIYNASGTPIWNLQSNNVTRLVVQTDGNLVARTGSGDAAWHPGTVTSPDYTPISADRLTTGQELHQGQYVRSSDKRYALLMQTDGNLVLYGPGYHVLWNSHTGGHPGSRLAVQSDGNVVIYSAGNSPLWYTGPRAIDKLVVQTDGNLVAYNGTYAAWYTDTAGQI